MSIFTICVLVLLAIGLTYGFFGVVPAIGTAVAGIVILVLVFKLASKVLTFYRRAFNNLMTDLGQ